MTPVQKELVLDNAEWARGFARNRKRRSPSHVSTDDMKSAAILALVQSAKRFDPSRGVPFRAYASKRIYGEIETELRAAAWMRTQPPSRGLDQGVDVCSSACDAMPAADHNLSITENTNEIDHLTSTLTDRQRRVVEMTFLSGMLLREAAAVLGIKMHSASELRQRALVRMRTVATQ